MKAHRGLTAQLSRVLSADNRVISEFMSPGTEGYCFDFFSYPGANSSCYNFYRIEAQSQRE